MYFKRNCIFRHGECNVSTSKRDFSKSYFTKRNIYNFNDIKATAINVFESAPIKETGYFIEITGAPFGVGKTFAAIKLQELFSKYLGEDKVKFVDADVYTSYYGLAPYEMKIGKYLEEGKVVIGTRDSDGITINPNLRIYVYADPITHVLLLFKRIINYLIKGQFEGFITSFIQLILLPLIDLYALFNGLRIVLHNKSDLIYFNSIFNFLLPRANKKIEESIKKRLRQNQRSKLRQLLSAV